MFEFKSALISICLLIPAVNAAGQAPVITESDIASIGDAFLITNASPLITFDPEDTGPDHNWDFSFLTPIATDTSYWVNEEDTDPFYFFLWLSSDIAEQTTSDISNDYFTIEDVFNFYKKNDDEFSMAGFAGIVGGIPFPIAFDENDLIYEFPLEYGNTFSSLAGFSIYIPDIASWSETRNRTTTVDGWGSVTTPYQTFDAVRTKSVVEITDTIEYDGTEFPFTYTTTEYKWLADDAGIPVLQINLQSILATETITQVIYKGSMVGSEIDNSIQTGINTSLINTIVSDDILLQIEATNFENLSAEVLSLNGQTIATFNQLGIGTNVLNLSATIENGLYLIVVKNDQQILSLHKFILLHNEN